MNRPIFSNGEVYHIFNRGVEKRDIFSNQKDALRFLESMKEFNSIEPIGSLYQKSFHHKQAKLSGETAKSAKLVKIIAYCLNPNHFHLLLEQESDGGISEYMKRLSGGYTWYFNYHNDRNGALFHGAFKSLHITSNEYLLHVSVYINLNDRVHQLDKATPDLKIKSVSSWDEFMRGGDFCEKDKILGQFQNSLEYRDFAKNSLQGILERRIGKYDEIKQLFLE